MLLLPALAHGPLRLRAQRRLLTVKSLLPTLQASIPPSFTAIRGLVDGFEVRSLSDFVLPGLAAN